MYTTEIDIQYNENFHKTQNDLPFWPERMKIEKAEKLVANLHDKIYTQKVIHIKNLKQAINHEIVSKKDA